MFGMKSKSLSERKDESQRIIRKYSNRRPIIVAKDKRCELPDIDKEKFLVPIDMSISQFMFIIRKRIDLDSSKALFITINGMLVNGSKIISEVYQSMKDEDGFLYVTYAGESTFG